MKKILNKIIFSLVAFSFLFMALPVVNAQEAESIEVWFFHSNACVHCAQAEPVLEQMAEDNENLNLIPLELSTSTENQALFVKMAELYGQDPDGVPTVLIGNEWIVGFDALGYRQAFTNCVENTCVNPSAKLDKYLQDNNETEIVLPEAVAAEAVDSQIWYSLGFITLIIVVVGIFVLNSKK